MNKRPGHVKVTTEVAYCSFCDRVRTLRREEHQLGTLVRTIVTCETCHRTLSSTMGVAGTEALETAEAAKSTEPAAEPQTVAAAPKPARRAGTTRPRPAAAPAKATKARPKKTS